MSRGSGWLLDVPGGHADWVCCGLGRGVREKQSRPRETSFGG